MEELKDLCKKIAIDQGLEGNDSIEVFMEFIPKKLEEESHLEELRNFSGHNEFSAADVKESIESFALLLGSIGTFLTLRKTLRAKKDKVTSELLSNSWKNRLLAEGIDEEKANTIVNSFSKDLELLLKR